MKIFNRNRKRNNSSSTLEYGKFEPRKMMAAGIFYDAATDVISIHGTGSHDTATVQTNSSGTSFYISAREGNSTNSKFINEPVREIKFYGNSGNDFFRNYTSISSLIAGGNGNDTLVGGSGADKIYGGEGNDRIYGLDGDDTIYGYTGDDYISAGNGHDYVSGWNGNDTIFGLAGNDRIYGGEGDDTIYGNDGNDYISAWTGNDKIWGQAGNDEIYGGTGDDIMDGGSGNDTMHGWTGNDRLYGSTGDDYLHGGDGDDSLWGHNGNDTQWGGEGADRFLMFGTEAIADKTNADVRLRFYNNSDNWTYKEVTVMDEAFAQMVDRTGNNILLKDTRSSADLKFYKDVRSGDATAFNREITHKSWNWLKFRYDVSYSREIHMDDWNEGSASANAEAISTMIHEIGHNWDSAGEISAFMSDKAGLWDTFKTISNWRVVNGQWTSDPNAGYARNYGRTQPVEDYATMWERYFSIHESRGWTGVRGWDGISNGNVQSKLNVLDDLFSSMMRFV